MKRGKRHSVNQRAPGMVTSPAGRPRASQVCREDDEIISRQRHLLARKYQFEQVCRCRQPISIGISNKVTQLGMLEVFIAQDSRQKFYKTHTDIDIIAQNIDWRDILFTQK